MEKTTNSTKHDKCDSTACSEDVSKVDTLENVDADTVTLNNIDIMEVGSDDVDRLGITADDQVQKLTAELGELRKLFLRNIADTENLRKRLEREKNDAVKYANGKFAGDLLGVADNFCRVMDTVGLLEQKIKQDATLTALVNGIILCSRELTSILERHGVCEISVAIGDVFDPRRHQAMCEVETSDHSPGSVVQLLQSGYMHNDRLLRPAMVSVSKKS
jgi:molecular chaperone GrpE